MERIVILGVPIDHVQYDDCLERIESFLGSGQQYHIATPNPEMLVAAQSSPVFMSVLRSTSLNIPDGVGLLYAARFLGSALPERVTGTDLLIGMCTKFAGMRVFLLGAGVHVAEQAAEELRRRAPDLVIVGTYAGSPSPLEEASIIERINAAAPDVLFVAYGAPAQELWISRNLAKMPSVRVAMGVGGAFDFLAGKRSRAPAFFQYLGLEWLWRLVQEPGRFSRIFCAVIEFPLRVLWSKFAREHNR